MAISLSKASTAFKYWKTKKSKTDVQIKVLIKEHRYEDNQTEIDTERRGCKIDGMNDNEKNTRQTERQNE